MIYLPELIGYEERIESIFDTKDSNYILKTIHKNEYYVDLHLEFYDDKTVMILLHNTTEITLSKLELLQYSNENMLLYGTIKKILDSQNNLLVVTNDNTIEYANEKFLEYFSIKNIEDIKERKLYNFDLVSMDVKSFEELYEYTKDQEQKVMIGKETFLVKATLLEKRYKLFTLTNVTQLNNVNQLLQGKVDFDPLTRVYRKQYFDERLKNEFKKNNNFTLAVIDIDNFKNVNDTYGHLAGDKVLKEFVQIIKNNLRKEDMIARWGGEEFLVFLNCDDKETILQKFEHMRQLINGHTFTTIDRLTASFGLTLSRNGDTVDAIYKRADEALYQAKKLGKDRVVYH
jgi:diguanylate cyclase (GGDEF)-like protein